MICIEARELRKSYRGRPALDGVDVTIEHGRIVGLIGPNGAGKSTALQAITGLIPYAGQLKVLGRDPWAQREQVMRDVSFIADVAVLPRWMRVFQAIDFMAGVHPAFDRAKAEGFLAKSDIQRTAKVRELSKGMIVQLHLALIMAIDARLLVLDEPTLGLDLLYRKQFYDALLNDYFEGDRTIIVSTHDVAEVEHILTDVVVLNRGHVVLDSRVEDLASRFAEVMVAPEKAAAARELKPLHERQSFGRTIMIFRGRERAELAAYGDVRTPGLADLFVGLLSSGSGAPGRAAA